MIMIQLDAPQNESRIITRSKRKNNVSMQYPHFHEHFEIYYLLYGHRKYFVNGSSFDVKEGNVIMIPKNVFHKSTVSSLCKENETHERFLLSFYEDRVPKELLQCFEHIYYEIPAYEKKHFENLLFEMENEFYINDCYSSPVTTSILIELLAILCRLPKKQSIYTPPLTTDPNVLSACKYIEKNYCKDIDLKTVASEFHFSKEHFSRIFKKNVGIGFNEYLNTIRINKAKELLSDTDNSITKISELSGFNDSNYFSTTFKRITSITPLKYRKTIEEKK